MKQRIYSNGKASLEASVDGAVLSIGMAGVIDEDVNFSVVIERIKSMGVIKELRFELGQLERMNSCGVREWLLLVEHLTAAQVPLVFVNATEMFVDQLNMIPNLIGRGSVLHSFQAPYHCERCDEDHLVLLETAKVAEARGGAPEATCPKCQGKLEFGWLPEEYFGFLARVGQFSIRG
jgi:hypothetical protein